MQREIFKQSIYFNIYGTIIEVPYPKEVNHCNLRIGNGDVAMMAEWVVDYTGKVYKNRYQKIDKLKEFLNGNRSNTVIAENYLHAVEISNEILEHVNNFKNLIKEKDCAIVHNSELQYEAEVTVVLV